jgi:hypothetical protein
MCMGGGDSGRCGPGGTGHRPNQGENLVEVNLPSKAAAMRLQLRASRYRAFVDNRPQDATIESPEDLDAFCEGLGGLQREACITAASVIGPPDPAAQLFICAGLTEPSDAVSCVRGTKVQNLLDYPTSAHVDLISRCAVFTGPPRAACFRWLGKTLAVVTDGEFARTGCPRLETARARKLCRAGGRSMNDALVTFS